jgi:cleavage stimulation factor subunit 1
MARFSLLVLTILTLNSLICKKSMLNVDLDIYPYSQLIQDAYPIRSIDFHPGGDFIISGTDHHAVRLYDIHSIRCFIPSNPKDLHESGITRVRYAPMGNIFASSSHDGSIKVYDGVSSTCISTIQKAHSGASVTHIEFSKSGKYILSSGLDSIGKVWDITSGKVVTEFKGCFQKVA